MPCSKIVGDGHEADAAGARLDLSSGRRPTMNAMSAGPNGTEPALRRRYDRIRGIEQALGRVEDNQRAEADCLTRIERRLGRLERGHNDAHRGLQNMGAKIDRILALLGS